MTALDQLHTRASGAKSIQNIGESAELESIKFLSFKDTDHALLFLW
jgi:hypothetical protein